MNPTDAEAGPDHEPAPRGRGISSGFIRRPVATILLTLAAILLGIAAFPLLPVAPLPETDFPTIQVSANLPGASPETMASSVATPLEVAFTAIPGITEMTSTSALGRTQIQIQFTLERDVDVAAQEVQAAINSVAGRLPADLPNLPTWRKVNPADSPVVVLNVQSDDMPLTELSDLVETRLSRQLSQIDGVGDVNIVGQQKPSIRVRTWPDRLAAYGVSMAEVRSALRAASVNQAKGTVHGANATTTFEANDQLFQPGEYEDVVVAWRNGAPVHLRDVAQVSTGPENAYVGAFPNGKPGLALIVQRQPGANIVRIADAINEELPALSASLPASVDVSVLNDRTLTIRSSLHEVEITLVLTIILVVAVMGIFLRQLSATLIVAAVLAVAVITTFAAMYLMGFSLNNLTLVALVIAVGFVVDDAIVVVENIHRHMEMEKTPLQAALDGAREIGFTVISITLSLIAAFIPLLFMGGIIGRLFREFSLTVTVALLISLVFALTLAPTLSARYMKASAHRESGKKRATERLQDAYGKALRWTLGRRTLTLFSFFLTIAVAVAGYILIPKGFFPLQDNAFIMGQTQAAEDISYPEMLRKHERMAEIVAKDPAVLSYNHAVGMTAGSSSLSTGRLWIVLKPRGERDVSTEELIARLSPKFEKIPGLQVSMRSAQDINIGSRGGGGQYSYVLKSSDTDALGLWANRMTQALSESSSFRDVRNDMQQGMRMQGLTIDRAAAARYGLSVEDIDQALYDSYGQRQIQQYQTQTNQYWVVLEADPSRFGSVSSLHAQFLRSPTTGAMIPLSAVTRIEPQTAGPLQIARNGLQPAANISFNLPAGVALGDAMTEIETIRQQIGMPASVTGTAQGSAQAFQDSLASQPWLILAALLAVYIILGVLYESYSTPLTILSTLPSAGLGAVFMLWLFGLDFSIMALIGIIMLIGIVKKNGILMVDFALDAQRKRGAKPEEAIFEAAVTRFRPIIMTTIAAGLAAIPLMLAFGTGSELRQPLGVAVVGGLIVSQVLTLFTTPVVYLAIERLFHRKRDKEPRLKTMLEGDPA